LRNNESGLREINYSLQLSQQDPAVLHFAETAEWPFAPEAQGC